MCALRTIPGVTDTTRIRMMRPTTVPAIRRVRNATRQQGKMKANALHRLHAPPPPAMYSTPPQPYAQLTAITLWDDARRPDLIPAS
jgi:hypothetical protein